MLPRTLRPRLRFLAPLLLTATLAACDQTVEESDLQKWTNNEVGLKRIAEVVKDPAVPRATKVRALEVMVEKGRGMELRVRPAIDSILDLAEQKAVTAELTEVLLKHLVERRPSMLVAKDTILMSTRQMEPEQLKRVREAIAVWAFGDVSWETPQDELRQKMQSRMSTGQIVDLGPLGHEAAGILVANAFNVDQMLRFLIDAKTPEASALAVKALRRLHKTDPVNGFHLDALSRMLAPDAAAYLLELTRAEGVEPELREAAYSFALAILRNPALPDADRARADAVKALTARLANATPSERWLIARNAIELSKGAVLAEVLKTFPDDKSYMPSDDSGMEDPGKSVMDLCFDVSDLPNAAELGPAFITLLSEGHRVHKAIAILCAKTADLHEILPKLDELVLLVGQPTDVPVDNLLGPGFTLGKLALNAKEGLALSSAARNLYKEGKYTKEQYENRKFLIAVEFEATGDAYRQQVEEAFYASALGQLRDATRTTRDADRVFAAGLMNARIAATPNQHLTLAQKALALSGGLLLREVLGSVPAEKAYTAEPGAENAREALVDLCLAASELVTGSELAAALEPQLRDGNKIQKAVAVTCAKVGEQSALVPKLDELALLSGKPSDLPLDTFLGPGLTLGRLAQNARDGLAILTEARAAPDDRTYTSAQLEQRKILIVLDFEASGDVFKKKVEANYAAWLATQKAAEAPAPAAPAPR